MIILGLDLSLTSPGVAYNDNPRSLPNSKLSGAERLNHWCKAFADLIDELTPAIAVVEGYALGAHDAYTRGTAELGGVVRLVLHAKRVPFAEVSPTCLKKYATGKGNTKGKQAIIDAALAGGAVIPSRVKRTGQRVFDDNAADAWWLYQMGLAHYAPNDERVREVPQSNRESLNSVKWPKNRRKAAVA